MGIMLKKPDHVAGSAAPAIIIGLFVAFGGILFGYVHAALPCPAPLEPVPSKTGLTGDV